MNLLLDTNILIAAYPQNLEALEVSSKLASELIRLANEHGHTTYIHPHTIQYDLRISDQQRREWRIRLSDKHPQLGSPPSIQKAISDKFGNPVKGSNDWVDHTMLSAVIGNAVDALVTEDKNILAKAKHLDLGEQVMDIEDALAMLKGLMPRRSNPMLPAKQVEAHSIREEDPIFESLRKDYPGFDKWIAKCKREHRVAWVIEDGKDLAALTIVKDENPAEYDIRGKTLKIGLLKVSESHPGMRYGESLFKAICDYIRLNSYDTAYVTVLPRHENVMGFFQDFGFSKIDAKTQLDEFVLVKSFAPPIDDDSSDSLEYHIRYGPEHYLCNGRAFIVPIMPYFHKQLFPELEISPKFPEMFDSHPFGNSIQKAYLSRGNNRSIVPGSILYFCRSHDWRKLTVVGIVEGTMLSKNPMKIASYVGKRTVYSYSEIEDMTNDGNSNVLAVLFRQSLTIDTNISYQNLRYAGILAGPPQSITQISPEGIQWIQNRMLR